MRPLPLSIMSHVVQYYEVDSDSRYEGNFKAPIALNNVYFWYTKTVKKTNPGNQDSSVVGKLYLDATNTKPFIVPVYGSKIVNDDGNEYFVKGVKAVKTYSDIHHYEVDLM